MCFQSLSKALYTLALWKVENYLIRVSLIEISSGKGRMSPCKAKIITCEVRKDFFDKIVSFRTQGLRAQMSGLVSRLPFC